MSFIQKLAQRMAAFMSGRNGVDQLSVCSLAASLILQIAGSFTGIPILIILSFILYAYTFFRIFSRKRYKRQEENAAFLGLYEKVKTKIKQFFMRLRLRKEYRYLRCPKCNVLIRVKRGGGERDVTCPTCKNTFRHKT